MRSQPDDPGRLTTCVRCGEPEAWGPMRLCAAHQPAPESWLHHVLRLVDERALLLAWTATRIWDGDMVDALIRVIGGQS